MTDFLNKVIAILVAFVMLVLGPSALDEMSNRADQKLNALNSMQLWIDQVCDKGYISDSDLEELNLSIAATGLIVEIKVEQLRLLAIEDETVMVKMYNIDQNRIADDGGKHTITSNDFIRISINEVVSGRGTRIWNWIMGDGKKFSETLTAMRR